MAWRKLHQAYENGKNGKSFWGQGYTSAWEGMSHADGESARAATPSGAGSSGNDQFGNLKGRDAEIVAHGLLRAVAENDGRHEEAALRTRAIDLLCRVDKWGRTGREAREELAIVCAELAPYDEKRLGRSKPYDAADWPSFAFAIIVGGGLFIGGVFWYSNHIDDQKMVSASPTAAVVSISDVYASVAAGTLNLRQCPSLTCPSLTKVARGMRVRVLARDPTGWWRVAPLDNAEVTGWADSKFLQPE